MIIYLDTETYSEVPITAGTYKYAENCQIIMWQWAVDDGEIHVSEYLTPELTTLLEHASDHVWVIHNSNFDRVCIRYYTGYDIPTNSIFDTMACALSLSLPGALGTLCELFGVKDDLAKDKDGKRLINLFCKPNIIAKTSTFVRHTKHTDPEEWDKFCEYGKKDISAMRELYKSMPKTNFTQAEKSIWVLDQAINDHGIGIDTQLAEGALSCVDKANTASKSKMVALTRGAVDSPTKRDQLLDYIETEYRISLKSLTASVVAEKLEQLGIPDELREILMVRLESSKASVSKYKRVLQGVNNDKRLRGTMQYSGASRTGRWAGRLFQPHNLPRGNIHGDELDQGIVGLRENPAFESDNIYELCSSALRGLIVPAEGHKLIVSDFSNIEGRVLAWLAGEEWKLTAFKRFDQGIGHDLYNLTYARTFSVPVESVTKDQRQIGKVEELAFGYQGALGACLTFAAAYGLDLTEIARKIAPSVPVKVRDDADRFVVWYKEQGKSLHGLSDETAATWISVNRMWRAEHQAICSYWKELETACIGAIQNKGSTHKVQFHTIKASEAWLTISLPSGRKLYYPRPSLTSENKISYFDARRKNSRNYTYGGKLAENITQAVARDILAHKMLDVDAAGYRIVLTVHDEIVTECPDTDQFTEARLSEIMCTNPTWSMGLPLAAKGFECHRYRKD